MISLLLLLACAPKTPATAPPPEDVAPQNLAPEDAVSADASANPSAEMKSPLSPALASQLDAWIAEGPPATLTAERRATLEELAGWAQAKQAAGQTAEMTFVCTHNSRRSHISALWAQAAALHLGLDVVTASGGTESTAFNPRAVTALRAQGFDITDSGRLAQEDNPIYSVRFGPDLEPIDAWSKVYSEAGNPQDDFAAVMVCSSADASCPYVEGASLRVALPYLDPKASDGQPDEAAVYLAKGEEIGREMAWLMAQVAGR